MTNKPSSDKSASKQNSKQNDMATEVPNNKLNNIDFDRYKLVSTIEHAGLNSALINYVQRNKNKLVELGVDLHTINTMRLQDFNSKVFINLPDKALEFLLEWLADNSASSLKNFIEQHPEDTNYRLLEYIFQLDIYLAEYREEPSEIRERARCSLACYKHEKYHKILKAIHGVSIIDFDDQDDARGFKLMTDLIYTPNTFIESNSSSLQNMVIAFSLAIRNNDQEQSLYFLSKVKKLAATRETDTVYTNLKNQYKNTFNTQEIVINKTKIAPVDMFTKVENLQVLTRCTKSLINNQHNKYNLAFSKVIAVRQKDTEQWYELTNEACNKLFPTTGCIIHFDGKQYPHIPKRDSYAVWEVYQQDIAEQKLKDIDTHMYAHRKIDAAHKILYLEHISSNEKGKVRQWLRHTNELNIEAEGERILKFDDNLFVHTINSYKHLIDENFKQELRSWHSLPLIELQDNTQIFIGSLPETKSNYHLNLPIDEINYQIHSLPDLTANEKSIFSKLLYEIGNNHALNDRLKNIDKSSIERSNLNIEKLLDLLMNTSYFKNKLEVRHTKSISEVTEELKAKKEIYQKYKELLKKINAARNHQNQQMLKFENLIEERIKNIQAEENNIDISNGGSTQVIVADFMSMFEERIANIDQRLQKLEAKNDDERRTK